MYGYSSVSISSGATTGGTGVSTNNNTSSHVVVGQICSIGVTYKLTVSQANDDDSVDIVVVYAGS